MEIVPAQVADASLHFFYLQMAHRRFVAPLGPSSPKFRAFDLHRGKHFPRKELDIGHQLQIDWLLVAPALGCCEHTKPVTISLAKHKIREKNDF